MGEQGAKQQYLAALVVNFYMLGFSMFQEWIIESNALGTFRFVRPGSILSLGAFVGSISGFILAMKFGRKKPLLFMFIPMVVSDTYTICKIIIN